MSSNTLVLQLSQYVAEFEVNVILRPLLKFLQVLVTFLSVFTNNSALYPRQAHVTDGQAFDYVIVGAGTAGCVLANRLTENPNTKVLVIEAGVEPSIASDYLGLFPLLDYGKEQWNYVSINDGYSSQAHLNKIIRLPAGKVLGGTGSISYNVFNRGAADDYDRWAEKGNEEWDWKSIYKYFLRIESLDDVSLLRSDTASMHGTDGPIHTRMPQWNKIKNENYLKGFNQSGYRTLFDINGYTNPIGYGMSQFNLNSFNRQSTAITYLRPIRDRANLYLLKDTLVTKIIINDEKVAVGVEFMTSDDVAIIVKATKEVILCAGAFNSPKLLMLSGVGPKAHLKEHNISVIEDSPCVGKKFIDTPLVFIAITGAGSFKDTFGESADLFLNLDKFPNSLFIGRGRLNKTQNYADYQTNVLVTPAASLVTPVFLNSIFIYDDEISIPVVKAGIDKELLLAAVSLLHPNSRGCVTLNSNNPKDAPRIQTGYYSDPSDLDRHARFIEDYIKVTETEIFRSFNAEVIYPRLRQCKGLKLGSHEYLKCYILNLAGTMFNFGGTCAMGPKGKGVVDARLRVRGMQHLRVVDSSVMPETIGGNNFATVVVIAEKAADMIKEDNTDESKC